MTELLSTTRPASPWLLPAAAAAATIAYLCLPFESAVNKALSITLFIGLLWLTEALPLAITALAVPVLALAVQMPHLTTEKAFSAFADPIVFLFLGGFALAAALRVQQLDRKIALGLLAMSRGHARLAILGLIGLTALLSLGINNTATTALMLPLALGLLRDVSPEAKPALAAFLLLSIAYAASIGGMGTMVGSAPNAIAARALGYEFNDWLRIGLPISLVLLPLMVLILWGIFRPSWPRIAIPQEDPIPWTRPRVITLGIFLATAAAWGLASEPLKGWGIQAPHAFIAAASVVLLSVCRVIRWPDLHREVDWGVLLLFGGGLTLAHILDSSGASQVLGQELAQMLKGGPLLWVVVGLGLFVVCLTELASNTATAALFIPIFAGVAGELGLPREPLVMLVALCASCAFALPVATPPNALVYGTQLIRAADMFKAGFVLNLVSLAVITLWLRHLCGSP